MRPPRLVSPGPITSYSRERMGPGRGRAPFSRCPLETPTPWRETAPIHGVRALDQGCRTGGAFGGANRDDCSSLGSGRMSCSLALGFGRTRRAPQPGSPAARLPCAGGSTGGNRRRRHRPRCTRQPSSPGPRSVVGAPVAAWHGEAETSVGGLSPPRPRVGVRCP